jgi:hypothetical protein
MPRPDRKTSTKSRPPRQGTTSSVAGPSLTIERFVMARLLELADQRSPWNRALWQASSALAIRECLEYDNAVRIDGVSGEGLTYVTTFTAEQVANDPGCGHTAARERVTDLLAVASTGKSSGKPLSEGNHDALSQLAGRISGGYLAAWHAEIEAGFPSAGTPGSAAGPAELVIGSKCRPGCRAPAGGSQAHCSVCHLTFRAVGDFTRHRRDGRCVDLAAMGLVERGGVWATPEGHAAAEGARAMLAARRFQGLPGSQDGRTGAPEGYAVHEGFAA